MHYHHNTALARPEISTSFQQLIAQVDQLALSSLHDEVTLELKPGLVCPSSQGSHSDMDYGLFLKSIQSMRGYYAQLCEHGFAQYSFPSIQQTGMQYEQLMLKATGQINTHKGAIFNLGFACAGIGQCLHKDLPLQTEYICEQIVENWQADLLHKLTRNPLSHGQQMRKKYGLSGAIEQVAYGFEIIQKQALPCFKSIMLATGNQTLASLQTLLLLISQLSDTNIVWRGGISALLIVQEMTKNFLDAGGVLQPDWQRKLMQLNQYFTEHRLSPGGSADLLGVTLFFYKVEHELCCDL